MKFAVRKMAGGRLQKMIILFMLILISENSIALPDSTAAKRKVTHSPKLYYKKQIIKPEEVIAYMDSVGIKHPEIVIKQALLETGHFRAKLLMDKNNLFAFRYSKHYMRFKDWRSCVDYYKQWQDKKYTNPNEDYYKFLKRMRYARSHNYIHVLKNVKIQ